MGLIEEMKTKNKLQGRTLVLWILIPAALALGGLLLILHLWQGAGDKPGPRPVVKSDSPRTLDVQIQALSGPVEVERAGISGRFRLSALSPLLSGDRIFTPVRGRMELSMKNARLLLGSDSGLGLAAKDDLWLESGALAGQCTGPRLVLRVADGRIEVHKGRFVLQGLDSESWSFLLAKGEAELRSSQETSFVKLEAGQVARVQRKQAAWSLQVEPAQDLDHPLLRRMDPGALRPKKRP